MAHGMDDIEWRILVKSQTCDKCGALPGDPCVVTSGPNIGAPTATHQQRLQAARAALHQDKRLLMSDDTAEITRLPLDPGPYRVIVADPSWRFADKLQAMTDGVKRHAADHYVPCEGSEEADMATVDIARLPVAQATAEDAVCVLWTPASMLGDGMTVMDAWGFQQKQVWIWIKTSVREHRVADWIEDSGLTPLELLRASLDLCAHWSDGRSAKVAPPVGWTHAGLRLLSQGILGRMDSLATNGGATAVPHDLALGFFMGRLARACAEIALVGTKGRIYQHLQCRSIRQVFLAPNRKDKDAKHSTKPDSVQTAIERMFPEGHRIELFARRARPDWTCMGNQCPGTVGEDIFASFTRMGLSVPQPGIDPNQVSLFEPS